MTAVLGLLVDAVAQWETPTSDALKGAFEDRKTLLAGTEPDGLPATALAMPVLGEDTDDRICILLLEQKPDKYVWLLTATNVETSGEGAGAEKLKRAAESIGGRAGLLKFLEHGYSGGARPAAAYTVHFHLSSEDWTCHTVPSQVQDGSEHQAARAIGSDAELIEAVYMFGDGLNGISRVRVAWSKKKSSYHVSANARGLLTPANGKWLPFATDVGEAVVSALFSRRDPDVRS